MGAMQTPAQIAQPTQVGSAGKGPGLPIPSQGNMQKPTYEPVGANNRPFNQNPVNPVPSNQGKGPMQNATPAVMPMHGKDAGQPAVLPGQIPTGMPTHQMPAGKAGLGLPAGTPMQPGANIPSGKGPAINSNAILQDNPHSNPYATGFGGTNGVMQPQQGKGPAQTALMPNNPNATKPNNMLG